MIERLRRLRGGRRKVEIEKLGDPIRIYMTGGDPDNWSAAEPVFANVHLTSDCTRLKIGKFELELIARVNPGVGPDAIQLAVAEQVKRGQKVDLPEGLRVGVPFPRQIVTEDGRVFYNTRILNSYQGERRKERVIYILRDSLPSIPTGFIDKNF